MHDKLREHVEELFESAPDTQRVRELRDEIVNNTIDRYDDQINEGKSEQTAYHIAITSIGDVHVLLESFQAAPKPEKPRRARRNVYVAIAVSLYILCVVPVILLSTLFDGEAGSIVGVCLMFLMIAAATALLIINAGGTKEERGKSGTAAMAENRSPQTTKKQKKIMPNVIPKWVKAVCWIAVSLLYLKTAEAGFGYFTWVMFPLLAEALKFTNAAILIAGGKNEWKRLTESVLWTLVNCVYIVVTLASGMWGITWLIFLIGAAIDGLIGGIFAVLEEEKQ